LFASASFTRNTVCGKPLFATRNNSFNKPLPIFLREGVSSSEDTTSEHCHRDKRCALLELLTIFKLH
jgi:hypothetical protein